jgi:hypothetical protein
MMETAMVVASVAGLAGGVGAMAGALGGRVRLHRPSAAVSTVAKVKASGR